MDYEIYSYRFAEEILEHPNNVVALDEIKDAINSCPLYTFPNKSSSNPRLDVIQQLTNTYFNRRFAIDLDWDYQPLATNIANSNLKADFRKVFPGDIKIHIEVQFGNMARWYSDIFKFQTAYSTNLINIGVCIVPFQSLARRIDSNVSNYERCLRELPAAQMSITLPILLIGIKPDTNTQIIDVSQSQIQIGAITSNTDNCYRIVNGIIVGRQINTIRATSQIGQKP